MRTIVRCAPLTLFLFAPALPAQSPDAVDEHLRDVALRVTALDVRRQLPSATMSTIDSLLSFYSDSVVYEHPSVGATVRGKQALRSGMERYLGSLKSATPATPRVSVGARVAIVETPAGPDPRDRSRPVPPSRRALRVLEFDERGLIRRIIDYPW